MIFSVSFSKPVSNVAEILEKPYKKIRIRLDTASSMDSRYFCEMFTEKQVFHRKMTEAEVTGFIENHAGKTFKNCVVRTEGKEITYLSNKKGKITKLEKPLHQSDVPEKGAFTGGTATQRLLSAGKKKNYLLPEGNPVPFLVLTGVMTAEGKVISSKYDKFRQINRFLEFINDVLPEVIKGKAEGDPVRIADFGCGKSYLTFAVHYLLSEVRHIPCEIEGLDLKKDVIDYCNKIAGDLKLEGIRFSTGDISAYSGEKSPDIVITLHACDTATDFALKYAVEKNAKAILSVPCCQHEVNFQIQDTMKKDSGDQPAALEPFEPLLKWGILREKFASLVTDALRGEYLEVNGYSVQMLEFIDMEHTPKNILIRAVRKGAGNREESLNQAQALSGALGIKPEIMKNL
ncbi:MAG: SAM-dependent methyltransferase [Treponema sp.]|nr:SAM-dependent methyltransferase [Treponema sp.]